jgi:hypothetical protein
LRSFIGNTRRVFALACRMGFDRNGRGSAKQEIPGAPKDRGFNDLTVGTWLYRLAINHCLDLSSRWVKMDKATDSLTGTVRERGPRTTRRASGLT